MELQFGIVSDSSHMSVFDDSSVDISVLDDWLVTDVLGSSKETTLDVDLWLIFLLPTLFCMKKKNVGVVTTSHLMFVVIFLTETIA